MMEEEYEVPTPWYLREIHCLDFEGSRRSGIVEYGLVTLKDWDVVGMETRLCRGTGAIPSMETATHHIRNSDVQNSEPLAESWELFRDQRERGPFAAHHAGVENGLIKTVWPYTSQCMNFITGAQDVDWGPWLDTCALYRALFPDLPSYNLQALIETFGLSSDLDKLAQQYCPKDRAVYHCASYDALASAMLLLQFEKYDELKSLSLRQLLQWSQPGKNGDLDENQLELL